MTNKLLTLLESSSVPLLADGAMGTMLHSHNISIERCFDELNLLYPSSVMDIHKAYIQAGAQLILTNTFGANRYKLARYGLAGKMAEINQAGIQIARRAAREAGRKDVLVGGDVGPLGVRIAPFGRVHVDEARAVFKEQIKALDKADFIVIETMSDLHEIREAIRAAREAVDLPVVASLTFTRDDLTILGDSPGAATRALISSGADVIGVNCSGGPAQLLRIIKHMRQVKSTLGDKENKPYLWVKPNAGWPQQVGGRIMYPADPEYFGDYALAFCASGANIIGGCCGTTPAHIAAMRRAVDNNPHGCQIEVLQDSESVEGTEVQEAVEFPSKLAQGLEQRKFVVSVEMEPPRGLSTHKLIAGASLLSEAGADVINVADSPMARMRMSAWAVCSIIQRQVGAETTLHFPTRGRNLLRVQGDLLAAHALGIRNIFVVMGDPTSIGDYPEAMDNYDLVPSGLIKLIKRGFNAGVDHSGASIGQPTNFFVGAALNLLAADMDKEIQNTHRKIQAGADFFLTQPIYRSEDGPAFIERYSKIYGKLEKPILAGILPLVSLRHTNFLRHEVPGIIIPDETYKSMESNDEVNPHIGVELAVDLIEKTKPWAKGIYIMPQFKRYDMVAEIIEAVKPE